MIDRLARAFIENVPILKLLSAKEILMFYGFVNLYLAHTKPVWQPRQRAEFEYSRPRTRFETEKPDTLETRYPKNPVYGWSVTIFIFQYLRVHEPNRIHVYISFN